jgi:outer membrane protein
MGYFLRVYIMQRKLLLISLLASSTLAYASDFKLGYVDVSKIFSTSKPALAMQEALKTKFDPQQKSLKTMNDKLVSEQTQMQAIMKKAPSMDKLTTTDRASLEKLQTTYQKDQMDFQQKYTTFQQSAQKAQDFASAAVLGRANTILKDISDKDDFDLVLTSNQLVYAKPKYDLTDRVIAELNKVNSAELIKQLDNVEKQPMNSQITTTGLTAPTTK